LKVFCSKYAGSTTLINEENGMIFDPLDNNETQQLFREFVSSVDCSESLRLEEKLPRIDFDEAAFRNEWEKIRMEK
jgi:hypothetical protein